MPDVESGNRMTVAEGPEEEGGWFPPISRRGFLGRVSLGAFAVFAATVGAPGVASGREPPPCRIRCSPISRTGCACGGHLYHCTGCSRNFHACIDGRPFGWICLARSC
jgi:hypothetical protein